MSFEGSEALGAWEDRPRRNFDADVTAVQLDHREAFVLTRIDGMASVAELCAMSGLEEAATLAALGRLLAHGLIEMEQAEGVRRPVSGPAPGNGRGGRLPLGRGTPTPRPLGRATPTPRPVRQRRTAPPFHGVAPADAEYLLQKGHLGLVPGVPFREPGEGRYGIYEFDRRRLLERCELSIDQKREIEFLTFNLEAIDHFEFFDIEPTDDRKAIRAAYFAFSKRFHPDAFFRKDVGMFKEPIARIFKHGTDVYEALTTDQRLRETYCRAVLARNAAYRGLLEDERREMEARKIERLKEQAAVRKDDLRDRLEANTKGRRLMRGNPVSDRLARAAKFYTDGMAQYEAESFIAAANSLRLAMTYDPKNEQYRQAFEKVSVKARQVRAEQLWKRGYMEESVARTKEAIQSYLQAVEVYPRADYCAHVAELMLEGDHDLHKAAELAQVAAEADPRNLDYLLLLARVYGRVGLKKKAIGVLERALEVDPKNELVKKTLRSLKK